MDWEFEGCAPFPSEVEHLEAELRAIIRHLMEIDANSVLRIEKIFHEIKKELIAEVSLH